MSLLCLTDSPKFSAWFAGSQFVDANGQALRMYHGTAGTFDTFQSKSGLHYFTPDAAYASEFADRKRMKTGEPSTVIAVYLKIVKPFDARKIGNITARRFVKLIQSDLEALAEPAGAAGIMVTPTPGAVRPFWKWVRDYDSLVRDKLIMLGFDGVIQVEAMSRSGYNSHQTWIAFYSDQIKSAFIHTGE